MHAWAEEKRGDSVLIVYSYVYKSYLRKYDITFEFR